jgi:hypothetical protein
MMCPLHEELILVIMYHPCNFDILLSDRELYNVSLRVVISLSSS